MKSLIDCTINGNRFVILQKEYFDKKDVYLIKNISSYGLLRKSIEHNMSIPSIVDKLPNVRRIQQEDIKNNIYNVPVKPVDDRNVFVSSFGRTHDMINGLPARNRELDWFFKGNGSTLRTTGERITLPMQSFSGGIEVEYVLVIIITNNGRPKIVGYTIANDFSDVGMRKKYPNLANLSKLMTTGIGHKLILTDKIPAYSKVVCKVVREGLNIWQKESALGFENMSFPQNKLMDILFNNDLLKSPPYSVHYLLLGASISTDKAGFELRHGDNIIIESIEDDLLLNNPYEEEAVIYSCCL
ncbi:MULTISPECIES: hypothetical protein [unclassified Escherichia]|uniref:hypothetical protein n=1 Tax=unclassified Escherichia TaxID=2608889 RepID=UPI00102921E9|nr:MULTISPECIES: hypothetical protein [unclassified Escherichia]